MPSAALKLGETLRILAAVAPGMALVIKSRASLPRKLRLKGPVNVESLDTTGVRETLPRTTGHAYMNPGFTPLSRRVAKRALDDGLKATSKLRISGPGIGRPAPGFWGWGRGRRPP